MLADKHHRMAQALDRIVAANPGIGLRDAMMTVKVMEGK